MLELDQETSHTIGPTKNLTPSIRSNNYSTDIHHNMDKQDQIITCLARLEEKMDHVTGMVKQHDSKINGLEKKWWSGIGAFVLAIGLWLKQLLP